MALEIHDLHVAIGETKEVILRGVTLTIRQGEVHALMGPNGSGKSTLANVLMGNPAYEVISGSVYFDGEDLLEMAPDERSRAGLFLAFQYPVSIPGVTVANFLRQALSARMKAADPESKGMPVPQFIRMLRRKMNDLNMGSQFRRPLPERGLQRWRKETRGNPAAGDAGAERGGAGRDGLRPGHRRLAYRGRRGQPLARPGTGRAGHHALPAHSELREAGFRSHHARWTKSSRAGMRSWR